MLLGDGDSLEQVYVEGLNELCNAFLEFERNVASGPVVDGDPVNNVHQLWVGTIMVNI